MNLNKMRRAMVLFFALTLSVSCCWGNDVKGTVGANERNEPAPDLPMQKESAEETERLEAVAELSAEQAKQEFLELNNLMQETFRDYILQFPPMSPEEADDLRAEYMELNLSHYVELRMLRDQMVERPAFARERAQEVAEKASSARSRVLKDIEKLRAKREQR